jgi:phosphoglycolate phosphatase-like HAD superfamily hydrolase
MLPLVMLDCDGVMFDSAGANVAYYNAVLERLGRPPLTEDWARRAHFLSSHQLYEAMFGADSALEADALRVGREVDYGPFYKLMRPMPELERVLQQLKAHCHLAMASNRGGTLHGVVREFALDRFLDFAVGAHDVPRQAAPRHDREVSRPLPRAADASRLRRRLRDRPSGRARRRRRVSLSAGDGGERRVRDSRTAAVLECHC